MLFYLPGNNKGCNVASKGIYRGKEEEVQEVKEEEAEEEAEEE